MNRQKIYWTPVAIESLKETKTFIFNQWNAKVAADFLDGIDAVIEIIKINPQIALRF